MAEKAPASIKPFFPCCGGPVGTTEKCICMVPADQQEQVINAIETQFMPRYFGFVADMPDLHC